MLGDFSTDFPNESEFEPSKVNINIKEMLIYSKVLIANRNDTSNFRPPYYDSDGQMVREFAPQSVIIGSIP